MNETGPDAVPPPARCSFEERRTDRLVPVPDPNLKSMPSVLASSRIDSIVSSTELMKHAEACWARPGTPMLNQTGLLNEACCVTSRDRKSTRLNSSHVEISYAVFCLKKKKNIYNPYVSIKKIKAQIIN